MKKTYYIQSLKKFYKELANLNDSLLSFNHDDGCALYPAFMDLLAALGFVKQEDGTLKAPKVYSVWGIRAYSKRLIAYQDLVKFIDSHDIDIDLEDVPEDAIEALLDYIATQDEYPEHVHQPEHIIENAVEALQNMLELSEECEDDDEEDDEEEDDDEEDKPKSGHWSDLDNVISALRKASDHLKSISDVLEED